jgi:hypothetical protein
VIQRLQNRNGLLQTTPSGSWICAEGVPLGPSDGYTRVIPQKLNMMKRIALQTFLVLILFSSTAFGQVNNFGLKIGAQSASAFSNQFEFNRVASFGIYGFADINLSQRLFTTLDLGYSRRGFTNSQEEIDQTNQRIQTVEATSRLSYISFSSFINTSLSTSLPLYIGAGPRIDFLINTSPGEFEFTSATIQDNTAEELDNFVVGGSFVAGIKNLSINSVKFRIEAKYEVDLTNSFNDTFTYRNNAIMLVLGFTL